MAQWGAAVLSLLVVLIWLRTIFLAEALGEQDFAYGISVTTALVLWPLSWDHGFLLLIIPLAMVWTRLPKQSLARLSFLAILVVLCLPPVIMWEAWIPGGPRTGVAAPWHTLTVNSYGLYGLVALLAFSILILRASSVPATSRDSQP
jgi:hypothetical protein